MSSKFHLRSNQSKNLESLRNPAKCGSPNFWSTTSSSHLHLTGILSFSINLLLTFVCVIPFFCCVVTFNLEFESSNWRSLLASMGSILVIHNTGFDVLSTWIYLIFPSFYVFCFVWRWIETLMHNWVWFLLSRWMGFELVRNINRIVLFNSSVCLDC